MRQSQQKQFNFRYLQYDNVILLFFISFLCDGKITEMESTFDDKKEKMSHKNNKGVLVQPTFILFCVCFLFFLIFYSGCLFEQTQSLEIFNLYKKCKINCVIFCVCMSVLYCVVFNLSTCLERLYNKIKICWINTSFLPRS